MFKDKVGMKDILNPLILIIAVSPMFSGGCARHCKFHSAKPCLVAGNKNVAAADECGFNGDMLSALRRLRADLDCYDSFFSNVSTIGWLKQQDEFDSYEDYVNHVVFMDQMIPRVDISATVKQFCDSVPVEHDFDLIDEGWFAEFSRVRTILRIEAEIEIVNGNFSLATEKLTLLYHFARVIYGLNGIGGYVYGTRVLMDIQSLMLKHWGQTQVLRCAFPHGAIGDIIPHRKHFLIFCSCLENYAKTLSMKICSCNEHVLCCFSQKQMECDLNEALLMLEESLAQEIDSPDYKNSNDLNIKIDKTPFGQWFDNSSVYRQDFGRMHDIFRGNQLRIIFLYLACSIRQYCDDFGCMPRLLGDLVPQYVEKLPKDPLNGGEILFSPEKRCLWSRGPAGDFELNSVDVSVPIRFRKTRCGIFDLVQWIPFN